MAVICGPCTVGYHFECWYPSSTGECHCLSDSLAVLINNDNTPPYEKKERGGQIKEMANVTDLESTGRKRAAKLYPIPKEGEAGYPLPCEWRNLLNAGGGITPIIGCVAGMAKNIHHGPDKNTLSNFVGNVHRICPDCHNRWHTANDRYYPRERPQGDVSYVPVGREYDKHDGISKASPEQLANNVVGWSSGGWEEYYKKLGKVPTGENTEENN